MRFRTFLAAMAAVPALASVALAEGQKLTLLSFNTWGAGANEGKGIEETVAVIAATGADIIAVQETVPEPNPCTTETCAAVGESRAKHIAASLGYHYHDFAWNTDNHWADAVISKYPIGKETANGVGVEVNVNGRLVIVYSMNLDDAPYQPYQLLGIEYGPAPYIKTAEEAVTWASDTRGKALSNLLRDIRSAANADAQFVMGDFNEPSHLDWTQRAVSAGHQPIAVEWPFTKALAAEGFIDTFRAANSDEVAKPGMTWTPTSDPSATDDHHDRIDFVMVRAKGIKVLSAGIVGEKAPEADKVVTPWPSDHRASMAVIEF